MISHQYGYLGCRIFRLLQNANTAVQNRQERGKRRTIVIVAEGAQDRHLNKISSSKIKDILTERLNLDTRVTVLGHTQRGGAACAYDRWLSTLQGVEAVRAVLEMTPQSPSPVITIRENKIMRTPLMDAVKATQTVTSHIQNKDFAMAMTLRDSEFKEYHYAYLNTATPDHPKLILPEEKV
jgi:6-phosphofructokinase 1